MQCKPLSEQEEMVPICEVFPGFGVGLGLIWVSKSNTDGLTISVVPGDVGKPTVKLEKAVVREGCCRWENPVYEPVKFVKDAKSGKINQKIYHFVVSTGAAKGGLIGEASIDFANYFETIKAFTLSLPLKNSSSKAVLHVTIQRVQENSDQREVEESEDVSSRSRGRSLEAYFSKGDEVESITNGALEVRGLCEKANEILMRMIAQYVRMDKEYRCRPP